MIYNVKLPKSFDPQYSVKHWAQMYSGKWLKQSFNIIKIAQDNK